ncbi:MAG: bifunctional (p)ppGpp synthetase/guanosine-3',5'-bis(diphosphate) 3'-pyrophosphohydrolase [Zoogloeaceae bacterium]|jgi:GTP pyrophosphokinase/guanosine-3',5'-bis(diphosphate) 3'-pyrophosphohydrolase|nr:bifunctional (p)ppGpp synthetase/guanosine-3',5'-bis(diphosphate) 3'-pyrophosphohydrolase [Zoogloeaceae bacterium]
MDSPPCTLPPPAPQFPVVHPSGESGRPDPVDRFDHFDSQAETFYTLSPDDPAYRVFLDSLDYLAPEDVARVKRAVRFSDWAHQRQTRLSGEPYITHPLCVAGAIAEWRMDADAICAALLHDVLEDTSTSKAELAARFGAGVAELVDGLSKLDKIEFPTYREAQAANFRKMLLATARDLRVVLVKLADRHHNLQTMSGMRSDKRHRIAQETLDIYAPIANRLGLHLLFQELQDTALRLLHPLRVHVLEKAIRAAHGNNGELFRKILAGISDKMREMGVPAQVFGRAKSLYSTYFKMKEKHLRFSQVYDLYGFRVIVPDIPSCYLALGALHALYKPRPEKFKDYIALPKENGYQSLHTSLIGPHGSPVEVQVRTVEMQHVAQEGIAAHWLYKDASHSGADLQIRTHKWLHSLLELQSGDTSEFFENVKIDLFPNEVYVFTPRGDIRTLPQGATAVDLAYAIHTDIGNRCVAARINNEPSPLRTELQNGDVVEIFTAAHPNPNPAWLSYVKTGSARSKIRHFLRTEHTEESADLGERLLNQELQGLGVKMADIPANAWEHLLAGGGNRSVKEVFTDIGLGKRLAAVVARRLLADDQIAPHPAANALLIHGTEGMSVQLAKCCQPIPGDPIIGSIMRGQGLVVHTHDCPSIRKFRSRRPNKWIDVAWAPSPGSLFEVRIDVRVKSIRGILGQVASAISEAGANIERFTMDPDPDRGTVQMHQMHLSIMVSSRTHLARIMQRLRLLPEVVSIHRARNSGEKTGGRA